MYMYDLNWFVPFLVLAQLVIVAMIYQHVRNKSGTVDSIKTYFQVATIVTGALLFLFLAKFGDDMIEYRISAEQTRLYQEQNYYFDVYSCALQHGMNTANIYEQGETAFTPEQAQACRDSQQDRDARSTSLERKKSLLKWGYEIGLLLVLFLGHGVAWQHQERKGKKKH